MTITAIILSHYKQREGNLKRIVDDILGGTVVPQEIIIFIDNPDIVFTDKRVTIIRSSRSFLPGIRFMLGTMCNTDYCFFIDDDLSVGKRTLENFVDYASIYSFDIFGLEGSILGNTETPYSNDTPIKRENRNQLISVDIVIRTYFVPVYLLIKGMELRLGYLEFPNESLDDVLLCLGNKYLSHGKNWVIPVDKETDLVELPDGGVGQSFNVEHYGNRNKVCRVLMDIYE